MNRNLLLTGGNGFIGKNIKLSLERDGWIVYSPTSSEVNLLEIHEVETLFSNRSYYAIIHSAIYGRKNYQSDSSIIFRNNVLMFNNLYKFIDNSELFINIDSGVSLGIKSKYDFSRDIKFSENCDIKPYAASKAFIARIIKDNIKSINLRLWGCFGPHEETHKFFTANILNYIGMKPLRIYQDKIMDFIHISDFYIILSWILNLKDPSCLDDINCVYSKKYKLSELAKIINSLDSHKVEIIINKNTSTDDYFGIPPKNEFSLENINQRINEHYRHIKMTTNL